VGKNKGQVPLSDAPEKPAPAIAAASCVAHSEPRPAPP